MAQQMCWRDYVDMQVDLNVHISIFDPKWPGFKLNLEIIKTNILSKIHDDCFPLIWLGDLVFDLKWPSFEQDLDCKFRQDWVKTVTSRVLSN